MKRIITLAGNPNSGKTSLFNELTGANQYVGNWPGVTVEHKSGRLREHEEVDIIDLPGIYSLSPYSPEEVVARRYLLEQKPDLIVNVVDATNLERNLYLTSQLMETGLPLIVALNMMDLVKQRGDKVDAAALSRALGCPVVEVSALQQTGIRELTEMMVGEPPAAPSPLSFPPVVEEALEDIRTRFSCTRWDAVHLLSLDQLAVEGRNDDDMNELHRLRLKMEHALDDDIASIIAAGRYDAIGTFMPEVMQRAEQKESFSSRVDRVLTHRVAGLGIFALVMWAIYYISIQTIGDWGTAWANDVFFGVAVNEWLRGFIGDTPASINQMTLLPAVLFLCLCFPVFLRRLHDMGLNGAWFYLILAPGILGRVFPHAPGLWHDALMGIASLAAFPVLLAAFFWPGQPKDNAYGRRQQRIRFRFFKLHGRATRTEFGVSMVALALLSTVSVLCTGTLALNCSPQVQELVINGIVAGVGAVLGFLPQMAVLFLLLSILEDCGYMARVAFMLDRIFRSIGLSGKSVIPLLVGMGCGVPAVMATRTIENEKDRRMSIMLTTFVPCGAKLPIIALIAALVGAVGGQDGFAANIATIAYFAGFGSVILGGLILRKSHMFSGSYTPFVMELPAYHMPRGANINLRAMERCKAFARKAGTVIFLSSALIWFMSNYDWRMTYLNTAEQEEAIEQSMLADIGHQAAPLFAPLGWGDWRPAVATVTGLIAKENLVGTCGVLYAHETAGEDTTPQPADSPDAADAGAEEDDEEKEVPGIAAKLAASGTFTVASALSFMLFNLLCAPCFAACGAIRREMNSARWTALAIGYMCVWAYIISMMVYQFSTWYSTGVFATGQLISCFIAMVLAVLLLRPTPVSSTEH